MKTNRHIKRAILGLSIAFIGLSSCQKDAITLDEEFEFAKLEAITISSTSAISGSSTSSDSLYAMEACKKGNTKAGVEITALPSGITTYLNSNYPGFIFQKAFQITNKASSSVESFAVIIQFNANPVALKFDASGNFIKVFEIREGRNMKGRAGWHAGGHFDHRDGKQRDTLAISALPVLVKAYFTATYPSDTLVHAFVNKDQSIIVISKNVNFYATAFTSASVFIKRIQLPAFPAKSISIEASAVPSAALSYLTKTYPNYIFKKAFEIKANGSIKGYLVLIDANLTKYAIHFDAMGQFQHALAIR